MEWCAPEPGDPRGPEVLAFSTNGLAKQMTRLTRSDQLSLAELLAFRMILDGSANLLAAQLRSPEQMLEMESTIFRHARRDRRRIRGLQ